MRLILMATAMAGLGIGIAAAQTAPGAAPSSRDPAGPATLGTGTRDSSQQNHGAASADRNQAVATTNANAAQPAKGANSFTEGEARTRIENNGFRNVSGLQKDADGIWRGRAQKDGRPSDVWLDYKGNVGTSRM